MGHLVKVYISSGSHLIFWLTILLVETILKYLSSSIVDGSDSTADVLIHCCNGVLPTHRLVLASISTTLLSIFKQDNWDEPISLLLKDYTIEQVSEFFLSFFHQGISKKFSQLANMLGVKEGFNMKHEDLEKVSSLNGKAMQENNQEGSRDIVYPENIFKEEINDDNDPDYVNHDNLFEMKLDEEIYNGESDASPKENKRKKRKRKKHSEVNSDEAPVKYESEARKYFVDDEEDPKSCVCKLCSKTFTNKAISMRRHLMFIHPDVYKTLKKVANIDRVDYDKKYGQYYTVIEDNPGRVSCNLCNSAISKSNINRHIMQKHKIYKDGEAPKQVLCSYCGKVFRDNWHRIEHEELIHQKLKRHVCTFCGERFSYQKFLDEHLQQHCDEDNAHLFPFVCSICGRKFMQKSSLDSHKCEASYQCSECGLYFSQKNYLKLHEKTCYLFSHCRDAIRTLTCTKCNIKFSTYQRMKQHCLQSTTCTLLERKPFQCEVCKKFFTTEKRYTIHLRVHTGEKPYKCDLCLQKFKFQFRLTNHKCLQ